MARTIQKLTDVQVKSSKLEAGRHSDGGGLYLNVTATGTKSWVFMWVRDGKRREMGMGAYPDVSLAKARSKAAAAREAVAEGRDPIAEKAKEAEPTFSECVGKFLKANEVQWKNEKHRGQWLMTLTDYCPHIQNKKISAVNTTDVLKILQPIWTEKNETASRLRGRLERIFDYAKARGWRTDENPAVWRGHLKSILPPRQKLQRGHHAAMSYEAVPDFMVTLRGAEATSARALEFLILSASRTGEVLGATWAEIDFDQKIWTVPKERMKAGREHRVPLTAGMLQLLKPLHEARTGDLIFPGFKPKMPLSNTAMIMLMRRLNLDQFTIHGFRSAFRDWCGDATTFPREVAEAALAHAVGDETERAYRRSDALAKRRKLMDAWDRYAMTPKSPNNVIRLGLANGLK